MIGVLAYLQCCLININASVEKQTGYVISSAILILNLVQINK